MPPRITRLSLVLALALGGQTGVVLSAVEQYRNPDGSAADHTARGNAALHNRQFDTAKSHYEQALAIDQSYFYALYNLGLTYQERARLSRQPEARVPLYHEARRHYSAALRQRPDNAEVYCNLGIIAFHMQEYQLAAQRFQTAHEKAVSKERSAEYAYNRGTALERLERWHEAKSAYEVCLTLNPDHFSARYNLGTLALRHLGDSSQARRELRLAHEIDPKRPEPLLNLAVLTEQRNAVEAERLFNQAAATAAEHYPRMLNLVRWRRALFYWHNDLPGKATKVLAKLDLQHILGEDPDYPGANGLLGQYFESVAQYDQAIAHLEREVAEGNFDADDEIDLRSHYYLAIIYSEQRHNANKALYHATRYYELRPDATGEALRLRAQKVLQTNDIGE